MTHPMKRKPQRKPRDFKSELGHAKAEVIGGFVRLDVWAVEPKKARKLAAWLLKAADYIEQKGPK